MDVTSGNPAQPTEATIGIPQSGGPLVKRLDIAYNSI
jgi:hypothetical protein